ncbi:MAG TPA: hypothetical protein VGJ44_27100 [Kribbellaceae bacterium]|jgi:hypothetical protein
MPDRTSPTPAQLRDLVAAAVELADRIDATLAALRADSDEHRRRAGFRLDEASSSVRQAAGELEKTAGDLARIAAVPADACGLPWGVCPEHGNTLTSSGGRTQCTAPGCGRTWGYDRLAGPCPEPITHHVVDAHGDSFDCCTGHAIGARAQLVGATITAITEQT